MKKTLLPFREWLAQYVLYMYDDCVGGIEIVVCDHSNKELLRGYGKNEQEAKKALESAWKFYVQV